ncbi:MAG TPA: hypothetical protein VGX23_28845 [Actinocrinis sp.]|nr:hypothetical protein [Actinocrinis sp.]
MWCAHGSFPLHRLGTVQTTFVPGLLQTPDYIRHLVTGGPGRDKLAAIAGTSFTADELVDSTGPNYEAVSLPSQSPVDFDDAAAPVDLTYTVEATDPESGFYKGTLVLAGPQGQTVSTDFAVQFDALGTTECGPDSPNWGSNDIICAVPVAIPPGSAAGTWSVSQLKLTNAAGAVANYRKLALDPITLTQNAVLSASGFSMTPSVVDNWVNQQNLTVTMTPAGAQGGIASVTVDTTPWCYDGTTNQPAVAADGTLSVTVRMFQGPSSKSCQVTGIAIVDGAGDVAAYGSANNGPALNLVSTQLPDTAPTLLSAALGTTSVVHGDSQADTLTMNVSSIAGIDQSTYSIYDSDGSWAGASASKNYNPVVTGGTITLSVYPGSLAPGTYTIALGLNDANQLGTGYGAPNGVNTPMPGGPLQFTVTAS